MGDGGGALHGGCSPGMAAFRIAYGPGARLTALSLLAVALVLLAATMPGPPSITSGDSDIPAAARDYGELPLSFARGGAPNADFSATTSAGTVALGAEGATILPAARGAEAVRMSLS